MVLISERRGAFVSVKGSSDKSVAGINVKQAFFAPAISMSPLSGPPPLTKIESIPVPYSLCVSVLSAAALARLNCLRRPKFAFSAALRRASRAETGGLAGFEVTDLFSIVDV